MANTNAEVKRHPLAIAWDDWLASKEGQECADFSNLMGAVYLENRLHSAFSAGASAAQSNLAEKVLAAVNDERDEADCEYSYAYNDAVRDIEAALRDLFIRLNVKID